MHCTFKTQRIIYYPEKIQNKALNSDLNVANKFYFLKQNTEVYQTFIEFWIVFQWMKNELKN